MRGRNIRKLNGTFGWRKEEGNLAWWLDRWADVEG
jgi:hypothetical protein